MIEGITDRAAWQHAPGHPLQICAADLPQLAANEIRIRNAAIAINPIDWILQEIALLPWLEYPAILGSDVAGEVEAVGAGVERFKVGDRVIGQAVGTTVNQPAQGAFQQRTIVLDHMAAPIPDDIAFADAVVIPLGLGTAASGLYGRTQLALAPPSHSRSARDEVVLVWGGSASVGCNAIQLAVASGYRCVATASHHNAELLKELGASEVIDYSSPTVVEDVIRAVRGEPLAGTMHATGETNDCFAVVERCRGSRRVAATLPPPKERPAGITATQISGTSLKDDEIGPIIYQDFLPRALATRTVVPAPPAKVVGHGLESLQFALEALKAGVSAAKVVVTLS